jgi:hypothetical protein
MKNHIHLLLEVGETALSKLMQVIQFRYTRYFNKRYRKIGHLFQGRYKAIVCDKDAYLLALVRYIHLNPVRAKVVKTPEQYPWIGHAEYLGKQKKALIDRELVLGQFSNNKNKAQGEYFRFVLGGLNERHQESYYTIKDQRYLGDDKFIEKIESNKHNLEPAIYDIPINDIVLEVCKVAKIDSERLYSLTRNRAGAHGRNLVAYLARKLSGYLVKDIAKYFQREPMVISQGIIKVERLIQSNTEQKRMLETVENKLIKGRKKKYFITIA